MHAQPGVYALLLGSGVSTGAGIPTGWGIVRELVRRVAATSDPSGDGVLAAWDDPDGWWAEHGHGELGYSTLLEQLAPTAAAARQGLLAGFFEPNDEEREEGLKQPGPAHHAIAELVKRGYVRVILTTNFDRLTEQALEAAGVAPQVIARPEAINGLAPLAHSSATVIKLHGDYKDLGSRNTPVELGEYPPEWTRLLDHVFDEYGLLISGWSADWDNALVAALEGTPNRRYPLYWDARSSKGENAQRLLRARAGIPVPADSADELFKELVDSLEALDRLVSPPLSTAMAVARLKRYLPDPVRRLDLHDLVMQSADDVVAAIAAQPVTASQVTYEMLQEVYNGHFRSMDQLAQLLITGVWHDPDGDHDQLWVDVLQKLVDAGTVFLPSSNNALRPARLLPAYIALAVIGVTASRRDREGLLIRLATVVEGHPRIGMDDPMPVAQLLHYNRLFEDEQFAKNLPRWEGTSWFYPVSHLFVTDLRSYFTEAIPVDDDFVAAYRGFEYRIGLLQERTPGWHAISGEYVGEWAWRDDVPIVETAFRKQLERSRSSAWQTFFGGPDELDTALSAHREVLKNYKRW